MGLPFGLSPVTPCTRQRACLAGPPRISAGSLWASDAIWNQLAIYFSQFIMFPLNQAFSRSVCPGIYLNVGRTKYAGGLAFPGASPGPPRAPRRPRRGWMGSGCVPSHAGPGSSGPAAPVLAEVLNHLSASLPGARAISLHQSVPCAPSGSGSAANPSDLASIPP